MDREKFLDTLLPLVGGKDNTSLCEFQDDVLYITLKDAGLADETAVAALPDVASATLRRGRLTVTFGEPERKEEVPFMANKNTDYSALASAIIEAVGGKENITNCVHCMTRLRLNVKDKAKVQEKNVKNIPGTLASQWVGEQFQIIIGQAVADVYEPLCAQAGISQKEVVAENLDTLKKKFSVGSVLDGITGSIAPLIPVLMSCGMIKIIVILCELFGVLDSSMPTHQVLTFVGDAGFYFMPVLVGATAAKKFGANMGLGMLLGAILIHPSFSAAITSGASLSIFGLPIYATTYTSTLFPTIISVYVMSKVERFLSKHTPEAVRVIAEPTLTILVMLPITLCVLGPAGALLGTYISSAVLWLYDTIGFLSLALLTSCLPLLVMTGMHTGFTPYVMQCFADVGREPIVITANLISNMNQGAACAAVAIKTKKQELRASAVSCAIAAIMGGVTEPGMFGITIRYRTPLYGAMIGSFIAASLAGIMHVYAYAIGSSSIFGLALYVSSDIMNLVWICISVVVGMVITFFATLFLYNDDVAKQN